MSVELYDKAPANSVAFVIAHLLPLAAELSGAPQTRVGAKRWTSGMPVPYWLVSGIDSDDDLISAFPIVRVHTFGATYTEASQQADKAHRRMLVIKEDPLYTVTLSGGVAANGQVLRSKGPTWEPYGAETVVERFVAEYHLELRFTPAT